jgi:tetratricopeptide (TPR) repeat protein
MSVRGRFDPFRIFCRPGDDVSPWWSKDLRNAVAVRPKIGQFLKHSMTASSQAPGENLGWRRALWNRGWFLGLLLVAAVVFAYQPVWHAGFIWDDDAHVTKPALRSLNGLARIWMQLGATQQYYPLVHSVFWVEHRLWGDSTVGYHLINILLHAFSALLLVRILRQLKIPGAWLAAAIFALHPVQVESVAWISELKNTLSGAFYLGSALAYLGFDRNRSGGNYALALGLFVLGLMSKTVIATLPAALLVVFWWQRGKLSWKQDVLPLIPFFVAGIGAGLFTAWVERKYIIGAEGSEFNFSIIERFLIAGRAIWFYLGKLFWPANLIFVYPRWQVSQTVWWQYLYPGAALLLLGALCWQQRRWRGPLAGLLFFGGTLFPALGFFNVYPFRFSLVADHFQYLAGIGPIVLVAAGIGTLFGSFQERRLFWGPAFCGTLLAVLCVLTWRQCGMYANIETLWRTTLAWNPNSSLAHNNLGNFFLQNGRTDEAMEQFQKALKIEPRYALAHNNLGAALYQKGRVDEAVTHYQKALEIEPRYAQAHNNLGIVLFQKGQVDAAMAHFQKALAIQPNNAEIYNNFGNALLGKGEAAGALRCFQKAVEIAPDFAGAQENLGMILFQKGQMDEAIVHYQKAVAIQPVNAEFQYNLGYALFLKGEARGAIAHYQRSLELQPQNAIAGKNLAWILATCPETSVRNGRKAVELAEQAARLSGGTNPIFIGTLAAAYAEAGRFPEAVEMAQRARQLAADQNNAALVDVLQMQIGLYQAGSPFRDASQANAPAHPK